MTQRISVCFRLLPAIRREAQCVDLSATYNSVSVQVARSYYHVRLLLR